MQGYVALQVRWNTRTQLNELKERLAAAGLVDPEIKLSTDFVIRWMIAQALTRIEQAEREKAEA